MVTKPLPQPNDKLEIVFNGARATAVGGTDVRTTTILPNRESTVANWDVNLSHPTRVANDKVARVNTNPTLQETVQNNNNHLVPDLLARAKAKEANVTRVNNLVTRLLNTLLVVLLHNEKTFEDAAQAELGTAQSATHTLQRANATRATNARRFTLELAIFTTNLADVATDATASSDIQVANLLEHRATSPHLGTATTNSSSQ